MDNFEIVRNFKATLQEFASELRSMGVEKQEFKDSAGRRFFGWLVESGSYPTFEDVNVDRNPIYLGGSWGHWSTFLGDDGILYRSEFRGSETYNYTTKDIDTVLKTEIAPIPLSSLVGCEKPFKGILEKVQSAVLRAILG